MKTHIQRGTKRRTLCRIETDRLSDRPTCEGCRAKNRRRGWRDFTRHMRALAHGGDDNQLAADLRDEVARMCAKVSDEMWHGQRG